MGSWRSGPVEGFAIELGHLRPEAAEEGLPGRAGRVEPAPYLAHGDGGGAVPGKGVDAGGDRGEGDGVKTVQGAELQGVAVAAREELVLALAAAVPDRADGVDDVPGGEVISAGEACRPVSHPPSVRHSAVRWGPAAR